MVFSGRYSVPPAAPRNASGGTYVGRGYPVVHGQSYPVAAERTYPRVIERSYPVLVGMSWMVYRVGVVRHGACGTKSE